MPLVRRPQSIQLIHITRNGAQRRCITDMLLEMLPSRVVFYTVSQLRIGASTAMTRGPALGNPLWRFNACKACLRSCCLDIRHRAAPQPAWYLRGCQLHVVCNNVYQDRVQYARHNCTVSQTVSRNHSSAGTSSLREHHGSLRGQLSNVPNAPTSRPT